MSRHREQELRRRVRHLHQELDATGGVVPSDDLPAADDGTVEMVTEALRRRGVSCDGAGAGYALLTASSIAMWAPDPSIAVRADFAADRVTLLGLPAFSSLCHAPQPTWRGGFPMVPSTRVFHTGHEASLRQLYWDVAEMVAARTDVVPSTWSPTGSVLAWHADGVRPTAEALALAAVLLRDADEEPEHLLAVDLGHDGASQALSIWMPLTTIHAVGTTFAPRRASERTRYDAVVVNLPSEATRRWGSMVGDPDIVRHTPKLQGLRDRGHRIDPNEGLEEALALAVPALTVGHEVALVILGDVTPDRHHRAVAMLREQGLKLRPHPATERRATYVQAPTGSRAAWTPSGSRPVTGRVVSAWTVHP